MRRTQSVWLIFLAGCASPGTPSLAELLAEAETNQQARIIVSGNQVVAFATPVDFRVLPAAARKTCETVAPEGTLTFCGVERGPRGEGFRVEKRYLEPTPHERALLVDADGRVLERSHTVPVAQTPQHVLATALRCGKFVERVEIVSGPVREEHWQALVRDRDGRMFSVIIGLDGTLELKRRRSQSRVDS